MKKPAAAIGALFAVLFVYEQVSASNLTSDSAWPIRMLSDAGQVTLDDLSFGDPKPVTMVRYRNGKHRQNVRQYAEQKNQSKTDGIITGAVSNGVFGSVILPFSGISTKAKWQQARSSVGLGDMLDCGENSQCYEKKDQLAKLLDTAEEQNFYDKLKMVNSAVNSMVEYRADRLIYKVADYWARPGETIGKGLGDCEDYAILKLALLERLGVPTKSMSLVVLKDTRRNLYHAILAVSTNKGAFVLDNVQQNVLRDSQLPQYQPLYSFSDERSWIHGRDNKSGDRFASQQSFSKIMPGESDQSAGITPWNLTDVELAGLRPTISY